ncbi:biopolymer transporter ExbD [Pedobacter frigiditerrae]|jgi:biopolymer transport protein ExbD|uniref:Biopolymer transporter ExbD n=1 Tax=Pedobacter frigiditerrae TaxID=2530452 RepID=A0A4R0MTL0_9SPHI|nr:biopolymer transporter ExbD [Pedobacter frigiditerrae]TCC89532.1 biopolymer transporter ExbD [Pedobacter frigiditerrae]
MNLRKRKKGAVEVHTSALNDIMFFLLLFFLLASAVVNPRVVKLLLPKSDSGQQSTAKKAVTVSIDENLNYFVDKKPTNIEQLQPVIEAYQKIAPDLTIILYVAKSVPAENIMKAYDVANKLKLKLVLAVDPKK